MLRLKAEGELKEIFIAKHLFGNDRDDTAKILGGEEIFVEDTVNGNILVRTRFINMGADGNDKFIRYAIPQECIGDYSVKADTADFGWNANPDHNN